MIHSISAFEVSYFFTQPPRQVFDPRFNLIANRAIDGKIESERVADVPILDRRRRLGENRRPGAPRHIHDQVRGGHQLPSATISSAAPRRKFRARSRTATRQTGNFAERHQPRAGWLDHVRRHVLRDRLGHLTPAGIAHAQEQNLRTLRHTFFSRPGLRGKQNDMDFSGAQPELQVESAGVFGWIDLLLRSVRLAMRRKYSCTVVSVVSSGWNVEIKMRSWRTSTGWPSEEARVSTSGPMRSIMGARMKTISMGAGERAVIS